MDAFEAFFGSAEWGNVGEWVSGIGTMLAVIVALMTNARSEQHRRETRLAAVFAWFTVSQDGRATLHLRNATDVPIYNWETRVEWTSSAGQNVVLETGSAEYGILPPGQHDFTAEQSLVAPANDADVRVRLRFLDAQGRRLVRTPTGNLELDKS